MGGDLLERLTSKDHFSLLQKELQQDYGLSPISSRALVHRIQQFIDDLSDSGELHRKPGQILYPSVKRQEPAGKPLKFCQMTECCLTIFDPEDRDIFKTSGPVVLRKFRLCRLAQETYNQGGGLSQEDLSLLLSVDVSTIKSLAAQCRGEGLAVPTRGYVSDIGSGVSHKKRVIDLYFQGLGPHRIGALISHSLSSVERYLEDFARVFELSVRGFSLEKIQRITGLSSSVTRQYFLLLEQYNHPDHQHYLDDLRRRFSPLSDEYEVTI
jgi:hypothetical protein